jgi:UDP-N-acetylglucosamine 4,6-dehydratase
MSYLIIGGTGTLGKATISAIYKRDPRAQISILSREELKQKNLQAKFPLIKCIIGDIRDLRKESVAGFESVFHFAAMKHVDICEQNLYECQAINMQGTMNVAHALTGSSTKYAVFCSTDKAVLPVNAYGHCKAFSEKYWHSRNNIADSATIYNVFRWGNVMGSRGSVVHAFAESLKKDGIVRITDPSMTRFWIHIDDVANFMLDNYKINHGETVLPGMKAASITAVAEAVARTLGLKEYRVEYTGTRDGEKIHECLWSSHEECVRSDTAEQFTMDELISLVERSL